MTLLALGVLPKRETVAERSRSHEEKSVDPGTCAQLAGGGRPVLGRFGSGPQHDLGPQYFAQRDKEQIAKRLLQRLRDLGVNVEVKAA